MLREVADHLGSVDGVNGNGAMGNGMVHFLTSFGMITGIGGAKSVSPALRSKSAIVMRLSAVIAVISSREPMARSEVVMVHPHEGQRRRRKMAPGCGVVRVTDKGKPHVGQRRPVARFGFA